MIKKIINLFRNKAIENSPVEEANNDVSSDLSAAPLTDFSHDEYLDCKEMLCPKPIFEISMKLKSMETDKVLKVECRDLAFEKDIEAWAKRTGNQILFFNFHEGIFSVLIKKS